MDANKKRKLDEPAEEVEEEEVAEEEEDEEEEEEEEEPEQVQAENGKEEEEQHNASADMGVSPDEVRALLEPFSKEQIMDLLTPSAMKNPKLLKKIRKLADKDPAHRKLFIRGLGWDFTVDTLKGVFSQYGEIEDCSVIRDKQTGKSKGYGFVTFKHMDAARRALKEPSKKIEGRVTVAQLASVGPTGPSADQVGRKIYVGNVPHDLSLDKLLSVFSRYGDIEEGPIGFDKVTGKFKGYALFIYKSSESAKKALREPAKIIDGHQVNCKMATSDGGQRAKADISDLGSAYSGGIVGAAPNLPHSALSGLVPGILGQHSLAPAVLAAQGLLSGLNPSTGLASLNPSLAHQLAYGSSLNTSLNPSLNASFPSTLNASLQQGGSQGLSQASLASYGLHGLGMYGSQVAGLGGSGASSLYGGSTGSVGSQVGMISGAGQGYPSQMGQGSGGRSQSLSGYFGT